MSARMTASEKPLGQQQGVGPSTPPQRMQATMDLSPLLTAIMQMHNIQLEFLWMILENRSASSRMHTAVEEAPPSALPTLPHMAMPSTGPSMPSEKLEEPCLHMIFPLSPSHISQAMLPVASRSPFALAKGGWELGLDIQVAMVNSVGTIVTKLPNTATYTKFKAWLSAVEDWMAVNL